MKSTGRVTREQKIKCDPHVFFSHQLMNMGLMQNQTHVTCRLQMNGRRPDNIQLRMTTHGRAPGYHGQIS